MRGSAFPKATAIDIVDTASRPSPPSPRKEQLQAIDALMGATVSDALAGGARSQDDTQAMLDHLEHLGDMRDRGLLTTTEYETAKAAVMHELEGRS